MKITPEVTKLFQDTNLGYIATIMSDNSPR